MLENFFIHGMIPASAETGEYGPLLVLLSCIVASSASFGGLTLSVRLFSIKTEEQKQTLLWMGAAALGGGIWSMHFIGMLACKMQMMVHYDLLVTLDPYYIMS